ncbi:MAG: DNA-directed RNA polymerase subunit P [Candidatus Kariarchaeaceae archaeon]|jgi:DNA-directed RNA polymerase subunit P|nr:DNA-directed RNA polymerase subunit P [Candidatus Heimdallarchaeota archaeon]MCK5049947.1 DNA-directed RNA polymerase subunit P [Candidatus Heimdallarchaeota archaeon]
MTQYRCQRCKETVLPTDMKIVPGIKCPKCGNRILFKERPPVVRKVKAR